MTMTKLNSAPPAVKVAMVTYAITSAEDKITVTAPTVSGYTFVCWVDFRPTNGYGVWKAADYEATTTTVWPQVPTSVTTVPSGKKLFCYALYTRNGDGTVNPGGGTVTGGEYTAGEGIWIKDHVIGADVTQAALDGKAAVGHKHAIADVDGLQAALESKAAVGHKHAIADVDGLQAALESKAAVGHKHALVTQVTDGNLEISIA